jgi:hypothetical protein
MVSNGKKQNNLSFSPLLRLPLHIVELQSVLVIVLFLELDKLLHQTLGDSLITLLSVEIVQLFRVGVQVVKLPFVDVVVEVDEFPSVGSADTIVALHAVLRGIFVIVVVKALTPVFRVLPLQER